LQRGYEQDLTLESYDNKFLILDGGTNMSNSIDTYIQEVLPAFLNTYEIPFEVIELVTHDIETRIYSCVSHWNDMEFRRVLLTTGFEEASFYEPKVNLELRCFVVVAIRNSLFENLVSNRKAAMTLGLNKSPIPEDDVKVFTQQAINHFEGTDFEEICDNLVWDESKDVFRDLKDKYPVAWNALAELGKWSNKAQVFEKLEYEPLKMAELQGTSIKESRKMGRFVVQSGMDEKIDIDLLNVLSKISVDVQPVFYTDCFKMLTRNIDKLFKVMEYVLRKDCLFMTSNFYISNGYVAKRKSLLRPAHYGYEMDENLKQFEGLHQTHLKAFKAVSQSILA